MNEWFIKPRDLRITKNSQAKQDTTKEFPITICCVQRKGPPCARHKRKSRLRDGAEETQSKEGKHNRVLESRQDTSNRTQRHRLKASGGRGRATSRRKSTSPQFHINKHQHQKKIKNKNKHQYQQNRGKGQDKKLHSVSKIINLAWQSLSWELFLAFMETNYWYATMDVKGHRTWSLRICMEASLISPCIGPEGGTSLHSALPVNLEARQTLSEPSSRQLLHYQTSSWQHAAQPLSVELGQGF